MNRSKLAPYQRGQAIVIIALAMAGLMAFAVLAIDGARFYEQRRVSQNASDMAAMAGLYMYVKTSDLATLNEQTVLTEIIRVAQLNGIPDSNGNTSDAANTNVQAWWVNKTAQPLTGDWSTSTIDNASTTVPTEATGVKVRTTIIYKTFMGTLIGLPELTVQTDSVSLVAINYLGPFTDPTQGSVSIGGGTCDNLTNRIAHHYSNTNTAQFKGPIYIDGSLAVGAVNSARFYDNVKVRVITGTGGIDGPYTSVGSTDPFQGNGNQFEPGKYYIPPASPVAASQGFPKVFYKGGDKTKGMIGPEDFRPGTGAIYKVYAKANGTTAANNKFFYIAGNTSDPTAPAFTIQTLYAAGKRGVFFVDGDLYVPADNSIDNWEDSTLIVNGRFDSFKTGKDFWTAGPFAMNISVMAGGDLGTAANNYAERCASNINHWMFHARGNNTQFHGIVYVPYGQIYFEGNTSGGRDFSDGIVAHSLYLGSASASANSWQFNFDQSKFVQPVLSSGLNQ